MSQKCHEICKTQSKRGKDGKMKGPIVSLLVSLLECSSGHQLTAVHFSKTSLRKAAEWTTLIRIIKGLSFRGGRGGGVLPYMGYIGMCRCEGYGFQAVYSRIGYINQRVLV